MALEEEGTAEATKAGSRRERSLYHRPPQRGRRSWQLERSLALAAVRRSTTSEIARAPVSSAIHAGVLGTGPVSAHRPMVLLQLSQPQH